MLQHPVHEPFGMAVDVEVWGVTDTVDVCCVCGANVVEDKVTDEVVEKAGEDVDDGVAPAATSWKVVMPQPRASTLSSKLFKSSIVTAPLWNSWGCIMTTHAAVGAEAKRDAQSLTTFSTSRTQAPP